METIVVACPHCKSLNKLPKKDEYKKAVCGVCKGNLLDNNQLKSIMRLNLIKLLKT